MKRDALTPKKFVIRLNCTISRANSTYKMIASRNSYKHKCSWSVKNYVILCVGDDDGSVVDEERIFLCLISYEFSIRTLQSNKVVIFFDGCVQANCVSAKIVDFSAIEKVFVCDKSSFDNSFIHFQYQKISYRLDFPVLPLFSVNTSRLSLTHVYESTRLVFASEMINIRCSSSSFRGNWFHFGFN